MTWWVPVLVGFLAVAPPMLLDEPTDDMPYADETNGFAVPAREPLLDIQPGALAPPSRSEPAVARPPVRADGNPFTCVAAGVADVETGQILYGVNLTRRLFPASTTKLMTALLVLEAVQRNQLDLNTVVVVSKDAASVLESGLWLQPGEPMTIHDLMVGIMVRSANDAAYAAAEAVGGTVDNFVAQMNERARSLGCVDTHFVNPHGLHEGPHGEEMGDQHYTTGYDLLLITFEAWKHPFFRQLCLMDGEPVSWANMDPDPAKKHDLQRIIHNRNKLLRKYDECIGVKTGYTRQAGACLVAAARRGRREVIAVTLKSASGGDRWVESEALLRYGLDTFEPVTVVAQGAPVAEVPVRGGLAAAVPAVAAESVRLLTCREAAPPTAWLDLVPQIAAPLPAGVPVGSEWIQLPTGELRRVALVTDREVPAQPRRAAPRWWPTVMVLIGAVCAYGTFAEAHLRRGRLLPPGR